MTTVAVRAYAARDLPAMAAMWNEVVRGGLAFPQEDELTPEAAAAFFAGQSFVGVAEADGGLVGLYVLHPNNVGRCGHIANASYAVRRGERGRRVGESLVRHSLARAAALGFRIMQFNAVVATNTGALRLYDKLGFRRLGTLPGGFRLPDGRYEDVILFQIPLDGTVASEALPPGSAPLDWTPAALPPRVALEGRYVRLEPLDPARHGEDLWSALHGGGADPDQWTWLPYGPFAARADFDAWLSDNAAGADPLFYAIVPQRTGRADGMIAFMRMAPEDGCLEIGHVLYGRAMQRTPGATEAVYLLARQAFALGNRRLEWKCDAANRRSFRAALRFGFTHEGRFRQHRVVKGRNRDTDWFAMLDHEWPSRRQAFERWLAPDNFDADGGQRRRLEEFR